MTKDLVTMTGLIEEVSRSVDLVNSSDNNSDAYWKDLPFANPYWYQFDIKSIPDSYHYGVAIWMTFFGILGVSGNLLVIYIFTTTNHLRTAPNILIVNMAFGNMMFSSVNGFPLAISSFNKKWIWGELCCQIFGFTSSVFALMIINTLAAIAMVRYHAVINPIQAMQTMSKKRAFAYILFVWIWSIIWSSPPLFGWGGKFKPDGFQTSCTFDYLTQTTNNYTYVLCMYSFAFAFPLLLILTCYYGIVREIFRHTRNMSKEVMMMATTKTNINKPKRIEIQVAKVAAINVISFLLCWTPYATIGVCGLIFPHQDKFLTPIISEVALMFAKASAAYNPIIYALYHSKFKKELIKRCQIPIFWSVTNHSQGSYGKLTTEDANEFKRFQKISTNNIPAYIRKEFQTCYEWHAIKKKKNVDENEAILPLTNSDMLILHRNSFDDLSCCGFVHNTRKMSIL